MRELLKKCRESLEIFVHTYAPEFCHEADLVKYGKIVKDSGGTLGYIAQLTEELDQAIKNIDEEPDIKKAFIEGYKTSWEDNRFTTMESYDLDREANEAWRLRKSYVF